MGDDEGSNKEIGIVNKELGWWWCGCGGVAVAMVVVWVVVVVSSVDFTACLLACSPLMTPTKLCTEWRWEKVCNFAHALLCACVRERERLYYRVVCV